MGLLLLLLVEAAGWPGWLLHGLGLMRWSAAPPCLVVLGRRSCAGRSCFVGMVLTMTMLGIAGILCLLRGLALA